MKQAIFSPLFLAAVSLALAVVAFVVAWHSRRMVLRCLLAVLGVGFLVFPALVADAVFPWVLDARYSAYRIFFKTIEVGVSRDEVMVVLNRCYPAGGPRLRPRMVEDKEERVSFHMNAEGPREPNCEAIILAMEHGKVRSKWYSAD
jgi:hypothetical protein